jgi:hypothetical protein
MNFWVGVVLLLTAVMAATATESGKLIKASGVMTIIRTPLNTLAA